MRSFKNLCSLGAVVFLSSCASVISLQNAKTLEKGEYQSTVALSFSPDVLKYEESSFNENSDDYSALIGVDYLGRYGITDVDEVSFRAANWLTYFEAAYKRGILSRGPVLLSMGIGTGVSALQSNDDTWPSDGSSWPWIVDLYLPVYVDFVLSDMFTIYTVPKYVFRRNFDVDRNFSMLGASLGLRYGRSSGAMFELGYMQDVKDSKGYYQAAIALFF